MNLRQGFVVDTHPEDHSVDLVMTDDGTRMIGVQVLTLDGSTRSGTSGLPKVPAKSNKWDVTRRTEQDQIAIVGFMRGNPVVLGFLFPQLNQMTFTDKDRTVSRHQSDVYSTISGTGDFELFHPSGTYIRIAENTVHESLTRKNFDSSFVTDRNGSRQVHVYVSVGGSFIDVAPDGTIRITATSDITVTSPTKVTLATPLVDVPNGNVHVNGNVVVTGDVTASDVSLVHHLHPGIQRGIFKTDPPEPS